jgi:hypothetical protein
MGKILKMKPKCRSPRFQPIFFFKKKKEKKMTCGKKTERRRRKDACVEALKRDWAWKKKRNREGVRA